MYRPVVRDLKGNYAGREQKVQGRAEILFYRCVVLSDEFRKRA